MLELHVEHDGVALAASYSPAGEKAIVALHGAGEGTRGGAAPFTSTCTACCRLRESAS